MPMTSASGWGIDPQLGGDCIPSLGCSGCWLFNQPSAGFANRSNPRLKEMKLKLSDGLLAASMSVCASGLICGAALIHESATGQITGRPERATTLFFAALGLTHAAVLPLELARVTAEREQEA